MRIISARQPISTCFVEIPQPRFTNGVTQDWTDSRRTVISFAAVQVNPKLVEVRVQSRLCATDQPEGFNSEIIYHVFGNGEIAITNTVVIDERPPFVPQEGRELFNSGWLGNNTWKFYVPRVGVELHLPRALENLTWFGRGPQENYADRKLGAAVGHYQSTVTEQFVPYVYPGECGGKEDARWLALTDDVRKRTDDHRTR